MIFWWFRASQAIKHCLLALKGLLGLKKISKKIFDMKTKLADNDDNISRICWQTK
jgi:hypothetical protein